MDSKLKNLKACLEILQGEYRIEDARRESITSRSGTFLQFSGVLVGLGVVQLIAEFGNTNANFTLLGLYSISIIVSVVSIIFLTISMKSSNYLRFPHASINLERIIEMSELQYTKCLIKTIQEIIAFNQSQNDRRLRGYSIGIWLCAVSAFILFSALISRTVIGIVP